MTQDTKLLEFFEKNNYNLQALLHLLKENGILITMNTKHEYNVRYTPFKHYNGNDKIHPLKVDTFDEMNPLLKNSIEKLIMNNHFIFVGKEIVSSTNYQGLVSPKFNYNEFLIPLDVFKTLHFDFKPLKENEPNFYDQIIITSKSLDVLKEHSKKTIMEFINNLSNIEIKIPQELTINVDNSKIKEFNKEYSMKDFKENGEDKKVVLKTVTYVGPNTYETLKELEVVMKHILNENPNSTLKGIDFKSTDKFDWNSEAFKSGGQWSFVVVPNDLLIDKQKTKNTRDF